MRPFSCALLFLLACGDTTLEGRDLGPRADATPPVDDASVDASDPTDATPNDAGPGGLTPVDPPTDPVFPDTIGTLTIAMRTGTNENDGTDDGIEVCLTATDCFSPNTPEVNDREPGFTDELHFEGVNIPRSAVDRVVLRSTSDPATNNDRWTPACLHLRFDGEPVYCNDAIGAHIGTGSSAGEVTEWSDPAVLHQTCRSCWDDRTLTHGPMLGAPTANGARVWVRSDATRPVGLRVGENASLADGVLVDWALPVPADDYTAVLQVEGLEPGATYYARVEVAGDTTQPIRPLRAALAPTEETVRLGFGSCTTLRPAPSLAAVRAMSPDLFLFIGDNHYGNPQHVDAHRWQYRNYRLIPQRAALMAETATVAIWDDHDFLGNNSHGACARPEHALRGFTEYWANPAYGIDGTPGVFFRHREGPIELFGLDCRMYRPDVGDPRQGCELASSPPSLPMSGGPLGPAQLDWALDAIASSDAAFKLVACGSRFTEQGGQDSWSAFDVARARLHDDLHERRVEGVVFMSGDIHRSLLRTNPRANGYDIPELTSSPLSREPPASSACAGEPGQRFCIRANSFVMLDVSTTELVATVHDESGTVLHTWAIPRSQLSY